MSFTDDNLKRLKACVYSVEAGHNTYFINLNSKDWCSLLTRLEAAEEVCKYIDSHHLEYFSISEIEQSMELWRKAVGK